MGGDVRLGPKSLKSGRASIRGISSSRLRLVPREKPLNCLKGDTLIKSTGYWTILISNRILGLGLKFNLKTLRMTVLCSGFDRDDLELTQADEHQAVQQATRSCQIFD
jgi:hypothetical protein